MSTFAPTALGVALALAVLVLVVVWSSRQSPRRGRVSWPDFERQFAEYVADLAREAQAHMHEPRDRTDERPPEQDTPGARRPD